MNDKFFAPNNGRFQVLTDTGFSDFIGVTKTQSNFDCLEITVANTSITTTKDHGIFINDRDSVKADELKIGDVVYTNDGALPITNIAKKQLDSVYDLLDVERNHRFFITNGKSKSLILIKNCLYIDEIAFIPNVEEFYESVFPTISSSETTKVIITSTPLGLNFFYKMWVEAESGRSPYVPYDVKWYEHPERDQKWYDTMCGSMSATAIDQEMNCVSGDTKITIDGHVYTMESLYNTLNHSDSSMAYINTINIELK